MAAALARGWRRKVNPLFIGSLEQIRADLRERQGRFGLSYLITSDHELPVLADVISGL